MSATGTSLIPLKPESIVDLAWGLSLFFSNDEQERKYGVDLKNKWDDLAKRHSEDKRATWYLDNVNAAMSGTVYNLAQLRQETSDQFKFLDTLKDRRVRDLDDLANLTQDAQSIATRIIGLSIGGVSFLQLASDTLGVRGITYFILGAGISYFLLEIILRAYRNLNAPRILKEIQKQKESILENQFKPKSEKFLFELLNKISLISKDIYGAKFVIEPGMVKTLSSGSAALQSGGFVTGSSGVADFVEEAIKLGHATP